MDKLTVANQLEIANVPRRKYRAIWLDTRDANIRSDDNKLYTFNKLPLIKVKKNTKLYVESAEMLALGNNIAEITFPEGLSFSIKIRDMKYNRESAISSTQETDITLIDGIINPNKHIKTGFVAELLEQELNYITLYVNGRQNVGSGAKNADGDFLPLHFNIKLVMEYEEDN